MLTLVLSAAAAAQAPVDLTSKSLEELMDIKVTSAAKKEEKLSRTPAAIYVITQDDIRLSGLTSIPELLRLVPGLEVARIDGGKWAITSRGFNSRFSNKLLVVIDGRSVYSPEESGVYWEALDVMLEDVERIEVIRGPGGALWGANAVNGVINIITKRARDTQGGLVVAGGGSEEHGFGAIRYGGKIGDSAYYRAYGKYFNTGGQVDSSGRAVDDGRGMFQGGGRIDWSPSGRDSLTVQGDFYQTDVKERSLLISLLTPFAPPTITPGDLAGGNVLGRWNHVFSDRSDMTLQAYFSQARINLFEGADRLNTFDVDFEHHFALRKRHDIVWGVGYRLISNSSRSGSGDPVQLNPKGLTQQLFSGFFQDEIALIKDRLQLTVGAKLEHNDFSGFELQPNVRIMWTPSARQTIWAAISRATRTPSLADTVVRANVLAFPGAGGITDVISQFGNPKTKSETLVAYELGYRSQLNKRLSIDVAAFYNSYDRLTTAEPGLPFLESDPPPVHLVLPLFVANLMRGVTYGVETSANLALSSRWKASASYSFLRMSLHPYATSRDTTAAEPQGDSPRHQFQLHSSFSLPRNFELSASLFHVDSLNAQPVPSYNRLDARIAWRLSEGIELSVAGQNLLQSHHVEQVDMASSVLASEVKRSVYGKITWRF
jgi:iron complex outermembrane receptor protein